jgi:hypothetical protein
MGPVEDGPIPNSGTLEAGPLPKGGALELDLVKAWAIRRERITWGSRKNAVEQRGADSDPTRVDGSLVAKRLQLGV